MISFEIVKKTSYQKSNLFFYFQFKIEKEFKT